MEKTSTTRIDRFVGFIHAVHGHVAIIERDSAYVPALRELLVSPDALDVRLEVYSYVGERRINCLTLSSRAHLKRGLRVFATGNPLSIPVGRSLLGRAVDIFGTPQDGRGALKADAWRSIYAETPVTLENRVCLPRMILSKPELR